VKCVQSRRVEMIYEQMDFVERVLIMYIIIIYCPLARLFFSRYQDKAPGL